MANDGVRFEDGNWVTAAILQGVKGPLCHFTLYVLPFRVKNVLQRLVLSVLFFPHSPTDYSLHRGLLVSRFHEHCIQNDLVEVRAFVLREVFGEDAEAEAR